MEDTRTTYLGQFVDENAEAIAERLEQAEILWWSKQAGFLTRFFFTSEWGVRLYVDEARLDEARGIVAEVTGG